MLPEWPAKSHQKFGHKIQAVQTHLGGYNHILIYFLLYNTIKVEYDKSKVTLLAEHTICDSTKTPGSSGRQADGDDSRSMTLQRKGVTEAKNKYMKGGYCILNCFIALDWMARDIQWTEGSFHDRVKWTNNNKNLQHDQTRWSPCNQSQCSLPALIFSTLWPSSGLSSSLGTGNAEQTRMSLKSARILFMKASALIKGQSPSYDCWILSSRLSSTLLRETHTGNSFSRSGWMEVDCNKVCQNRKLWNIIGL